MTTLNTIIEEEVEAYKNDYAQAITDVGGFGLAKHIERFLTTAMQRAYEAGEREADAKWEREVELLRTIPEHSSECLINEFPEHCDCDNYVNSNRTLDTLLSKIRS